MAKFIQMSTRICERYQTRTSEPDEQRKIADLAYRFWLTREFKNGSPQEDWLRAQREVYRQRYA